MLENVWKRLKNFRQKDAVILMYHQVCNRRIDPWELAVSPDRFELQLNYLKKNFEVVSLEELVSCLTKKNLTKKMAAITFDDGFADNYTTAAPLLEWHKLPATFYFATEPLNNPRTYWWDDLQAIVLQTNHLPRFLQIKIGDEDFKFKFIDHQILTSRILEKIREWKYGMPVPNERIELYLKLWERIQPLSHGEQTFILQTLKEWAGCDFRSCNDATMGAYQMQKMSQNNLFSIGAHTVHHAMLAARKKEEQKFEIDESKRVIEKLCGKNINGFAYPYGNYDSVTKALLKDAGYSYAVSTQEGVVDTDADLFELPRIQVKNWEPGEFSKKMDELKLK